MNVTDYLRIFRHYWWLLAIFTLVGVVIGYASWVVNWWIIDFGPKYQSTATLFVATQTGTTTAEAYQNDMFSQQRAVSYAALATSEQVAARAANELKSSISPGDLRAKTSTKVRDKTVMLDVSVSDSSPAQAQAYADAVSNQLVEVVNQLETSRRGGTPSATAVIVDNANYPTEPAGLKLLMRLLLGAAGGLIVGILVALIAGSLDKRLRARENIESETGSLVMGALPKDPVRKNAGVVDLAGNGLYAERIRELRTNLRFTVPPGGSGPARCIAVTSPSVGDGRTTTAIDLAAAFAESGRSVILIDGDMRNPCVADRLPLEESARDRAYRSGLSTVLIGEDDIGSAVISHVDIGDHSITVLPAGPVPPRPGELWATDRATQLLGSLVGAFDYVVVDTPPLGDYTDGAIVGALGDGAILLARIAGTTDRALRRAVQVLQAAHVAILGTVVTFESVGRGALRTHAKQRGRTGVQPRESGTPVESQ